MDTIKDFVDSDDIGWDVTRSAFLSKLVDEIVNHPNVFIVIKGTQTYLLKKEYLRVKVVTNGRSIESQLEDALSRDESGDSD